MPEQQVDYDTDDIQPTPGPWDFSKQMGEAGEAFLAQVWGPDGDSLAVVEPQSPHADEATANARLIAAAGTAASELPDKYDPVEAMKLLPLLLEAFEEGREGQLAFSKKLWNALIAARGDSDE